MMTCTVHMGSCSFMAIFIYSDLQGHLEGIEEHLSRQKQALREASAKHQVSRSSVPVMEYLWKIAVYMYVHTVYLLPLKHMIYM